MDIEKYREWIAISQYEGLAPEQEAELAAHLAAHPESRRFQDEVRALRRGLDAWKPVEAPLTADDILAQVQPYPAVVQPLPRPRVSLSLWRRGLAAAAGFVLLALVWMQGLAVEIGGHRVFALNAPASTTLQELQTRLAQLETTNRQAVPSLEQLAGLVDERIDHQVAPRLEQILAAVNTYQDGSLKALAALRRETDKRFEELVFPRYRTVAYPSVDGGQITPISLEAR
ncbi:hypothetical protein HS125_00445 [bacterium]|nr:hypothetical protein [bacterium]